MADSPLKNIGTGAGKFFAKVLVFGIGILALIFLLFQVVDSNDADSTIVLQSLTGNLRVITEPGPYLRFFGKPHTYKKVIAVNFTGEKGATAASLLDEISVRFLDTSIGQAKGVARFRMPTGDQDMIKIHREFGSQDSLASNLLERMVKEAVKASARTMSVEEHYSGGSGQMSLDFDDQIRNGMFVVDQVTEYVPVSPEENLFSEPDARGKETLGRRQRVLVVKRKDDKGAYIRTKNSLADYNIAVISASIEEVNYEQRVDERLAAQKQAVADEALARQNLKKAQQEAKTAAALGEKAIAEARAGAEKEKLQAEIQAEKEKAVAEINAKREVEVARQRTLKQEQTLEMQKKEAEGLMVMAQARAKAAENALDPQLVFEKKLQAWKEVETAKYQYMSQAQLVPTVQMGQGGNSHSNAMSLLELMGVKAAMDLGMEFQNIGKTQGKTGDQ